MAPTAQILLAEPREQRPGISPGAAASHRARSLVSQSLRCCRSRGRRRKAECVGDDGVGASAGRCKIDQQGIRQSFRNCPARFIASRTWRAASSAYSRAVPCLFDSFVATRD